MESITYWLDVKEIVWGDSITGKISEGLNRSGYVVVFLSGNYLESNWACAET